MVLIKMLALIRAALASGDFGDIFSDFFGSGNRKRQHTNRGSDLQYNLEIDLKQAVEGATVKIRIPKYEKCDKCAGSGATPGSKITTCPICHGSGKNTKSARVFCCAALLSSLPWRR